MASSIINLSGDLTNDKCIRLSNSYCARSHGVSPLSWRRLWIGMRLNFTYTGSSLASEPKLRVGLCSGRDNAPPGSNGHALYFETTDAWTDATVDGQHAEFNLNGTNSQRWIAMRNGATSIMASGSGDIQFASSDQTSDQQYWSVPFFLEFYKATFDAGTGLGLTWDVSARASLNTTTYTGADDDLILAGLDLSTFSDITGTNVGIGTGLVMTAAVSDTAYASSEIAYGPLDTFFTSWDRSVSTCQIGCIFANIKKEL